MTSLFLQPESPANSLFNSPKLLLSINEVKQQTGLGRTTIYKAISARELPVLKVGSRTLVPYGGLIAWIEHLSAPFSGEC